MELMLDALSDARNQSLRLGGGWAASLRTIHTPRDVTAMQGHAAVRLFFR